MENSGGIQSNITAGLAGRYAVALFDLARESNAIDAVAKSLATLRTGLADSADLSALIAKDHPTAQIFVYDANHGFNSDRRKDYHEPSSEQARERTLMLFKACGG